MGVVRKVRKPTRSENYIFWTDQMRQAADGVKVNLHPTHAKVIFEARKKKLLSPESPPQKSAVAESASKTCHRGTYIDD